MKCFIFAILGVLLCTSLYATPQMPEQLVFEGDTLDLNAYPLSPYVRNLKGRQDFSSLNDFTYSTGCSRGYIGVWSIQNDSLFLNDLTTGSPSGITYRILNENVLKESNLPEDVQKSLRTNTCYYNWYSFSDIIKAEIGRIRFRHFRQIIADCYEYDRDSTERIRADLNLFFEIVEILPTNSSNQPVFAEWFSGELICPIGEMLKYVHRTFHSIYEKELHLFIKDGVVTYSFLVTNEPLNETTEDSTHTSQDE